MLSYCVLLYFDPCTEHVCTHFEYVFWFVFVGWVIEEFCVFVMWCSYPFLFPFGCCVEFNFVSWLLARVLVFGFLSYVSLLLLRLWLLFCKGALFRGKGGPPVLEKPARHLPRQGRGFVRPPVCPTPPAISSPYGRASGGQLTDCWHQMSSYVQYIQQILSYATYLI